MWESNFNSEMQYKATWVDCSNDKRGGEPDYFQYDTVTHGSLLGLIFRLCKRCSYCSAFIQGGFFTWQLMVF